MIADKITVLNRTALDSLKNKHEKHILKNFCNVAIKILGADFGFVWVKRKNLMNLELAYKSAGTPFLPTTPRKTGTTYSVLHRKTPLLINKISKTESVRAFAKKYLEGLAIIPITYKNNTYGNMYICYRNEKHFTNEDKALCASIGNSAAQALTIRRLNQSLQDIKYTLDHTPEPIIILDPETKLVSYYNNSLINHTGLTKNSLIKASVLEIIHPTFRKIFDKRLKRIAVEKIPSSIFEVYLTTPSQKKLPVEASIQYVNLPGQPPHLLAIFRDLRERKKTEEKIKRAAFHDTLTGLPNRFLFTERLQTLIKNSRQKKRIFAVIFVDLDRFKFINDTLGHIMGDELLRQAAKRLKRNIKRTDTVSRLGGDEFVILLGNIRSIKQADQVAQRIQKSFSAPFRLSTRQEVYVNFSMGISTFPKDGEDEVSLLRRADNALYRAKQEGGNSYQHYRQDMDIPEPSRLEIEKELRRAIQKRELTLHYQPIIDNKTQKAVSVEALIRWHHPTMGLISPAIFIPYAEESGLIVTMGEWVFNEACRQLKAWRKRRITLNMNINISARELLEKSMIKKMLRILKKHKLKPHDITLELTETFLIKNIQLSTEMLTKVRKLGFKTSLDDFGTGYTSINYLKTLPINYIKIGQLFVDDITTNQRDANITKAIITISRQLQVKTVAEGVETKAQAKLLKSLGCDLMQGNFYCASGPVLNIEECFKKKFK